MVRLRINPWALCLGMVALCAVVAGVTWKVRCASVAPSKLAAYLPDDVSTVVAVDVAALRSSGILDTIAGSPGGEEPDYRGFVEATGFDFRRDLDHVVIGFRPDSTYVLASGRYDWDSMRRYAQQQGGNCNNAFCRMPGSDPMRNISFFPIRGGILGVAAAPDQWAAWDLTQHDRPDLPKELIDQPVMISISKDALKRGERAPDGMRPWLRLLENADRLIVTFSAEDSAGWLMKARIRCSSDADSTLIENQLQMATNELRAGIQRKGQAVDDTSLGAILAGGSFQKVGAEVQGRWPISAQFLESLAGGKQ